MVFVLALGTGATKSGPSKLCLYCRDGATKQSAGFCDPLYPLTCSTSQLQSVLPSLLPYGFCR